MGRDILFQAKYFLSYILLVPPIAFWTAGLFFPAVPIGIWHPLEHHDF